MNFLIFSFNGHCGLEALAESVKHYQIVTFDISRGREIRTPINGFGDHYTNPYTMPLYKRVSVSQDTLNLSIVRLFDNLTNLAGADCTSTLTDSETKTLVKRYWSDEMYLDLYVIAWHNHLGSLWKSNLTGNIKCTDEELRTVVVVEWSVTSTFLFLEDVNLSTEVSVRSD